MLRLIYSCFDKVGPCDIVLCRKDVELWTLLSRLITELNWKKAKRRISTWTLLGNWKMWNMKVTVIPIVIGALNTVIKGLVQGKEDLEIRGRVETIALLKSTRILRRVMKTWRDLLPLNLQWETIGYRWCEKLEKEKIIIFCHLANYTGKIK